MNYDLILQRSYRSYLSKSSYTSLILTNKYFGRDFQFKILVVEKSGNKKIGLDISFSPTLEKINWRKVGFHIVSYKTILRVSWFSSWFSAKWSMSFVIKPCKKSALSVPATRITERLARWHFLKNVWVAKFRELTTWRPTLFSNMMIWQVFLQQILLSLKFVEFFVCYNFIIYLTTVLR